MTRHPIRVLHVLGSLNPGGVETWLINILRHMDRERFEMHFCTFGPEPGVLAPEVERLGGCVIPCPIEKTDWLLGRRFRRILREGHYDIVHSHVLYFSGVVLRWAKQEGVSVRIAHAHSTSDGRPAVVWRRVYRNRMRACIRQNATAGFAASMDAAAVLFGPDWQRNEQRHLLYYGIELQPFEGPLDRAEMRRGFEIPEQAPIIGHVGRFVEAKNHRFLLQVARELLNKIPQAHFLLIGDGALREEIEAGARAMNLGNQLHFAGVRKDVPRLLRGAMDIFLFPSLWEGLGLALVEAQAAGLPCLVSDAVPRDAVVVPELMHYLRLSEGAEEWAAKLATLLQQSPKERCGDLSALKQSHFCIDRSVENLSELYMESIAHSGSRG